jgi:hypothetical protein
MRQSNGASQPDEDELDDMFDDGAQVPSGLEDIDLSEAAVLSTRLRNCYKNSKAENLAAFLKLGMDGRKKLRNYGKKTEAELRSIVLTLIRTAAHLNPVAANPRPFAKKLPPSYERLKGLAYPWKAITAQDWESYRTAVGVAGDTIVGEVAMQLGTRWPSRAGTEKVEEYLSLHYTSIPSLKRMGRVKLNTLALVVAYLAENPGFGKEAFACFEDLRAMPQLKCLSDVEVEILERRLFKAEREQVTLEELAVVHKVTRERIRQIEAGILDSIRDGRNGKRVTDLLDREASRIFSRLCLGEMVLPVHELANRCAVVFGFQQLAIYTEAPTLAAWLDKRFTRMGHLWVDSTVTDWVGIRARFASLEASRLPLPSQVLEQEFSATPQEVRAWCQITERGIWYEGYILSKMEARQRRAAIAHRLASARASQVVTTVQLLSHWPSPVRNVRGFERLLGYAIRSTPSLFLSSSQVAVPLHDRYAPAPLASNAVVMEERETEVNDTSSEANASEKLEQFVNEKGPLSLGDLKAQTGVLSDLLQLSEVSIAIYLTQNPTAFVRIAPGLYDTRNRWKEPSRIERARMRLLESNDVRRYCLSRYAGEPAGTLFPLWDHEQERRWLKWGESALERNLFTSLLSMSSPEEWREASPAERDYWKSRKTSARWWLPVPDFSGAPPNKPSVESVLLVAAVVRMQGGISWIRANNYLGATQVVERAGYSAIMFATALGFLEPNVPSGFVRMQAAPRMEEIWGEWLRLLTKCPRPTWNERFVAGMIDRAIESAQKGQLGWLRASDLRALRDSDETQELGSMSHETASRDDSDDIKI